MSVISKYLFFAAILMTCLFFSCKKDDKMIKETDRVVNELLSVIEDNNISRVVPIKGNDSFTNSISASAGDKFDFSDGFLRINGFAYDAYNLQSLKNYKVALVTVVYNPSRSRSEKALLVYFN